MLTLLIGAKLFETLNYKDTGGGGGWQRFYQMDDETDVYFVGSSHAHCTIDHGFLWENYGIAGYTLSAGSQKLDSSYYFVEEILRTKHPKVIAVEVWDAVGDTLQNEDEDVYRNSLGMRWSVNLWNFVNYFADNRGLDSTWRDGIFIKLPIIHSRYRELTQEDFYDEMPFMRGYRGSFEVSSFERPTAENNSDVLALHSERLAMLENIVGATKEANVELVLFASPYYLSEEDQMKFNAVAEFAKSNDVPFINFNHLYDEIGIDFSTDFRDSIHVNNYGAVKVTKYIADFLTSEYKLTDRRGQEGYELWEQNALYLRNKGIQHELRDAPDINEYLKKVQEIQEGKTIILALTGNHTALGDVYMDSLIQMGITEGEYRGGGAWIIKDGEIVTRLLGSEYNYCVPTLNGEIYLESSVLQEGEDQSEKVALVVDGTDYYMVTNGVNIIVYDETLSQLIDAAGDDIYLGLEMAHYPD